MLGLFFALDLFEMFIGRLDFRIVDVDYGSLVLPCLAKKLPWADFSYFPFWAGPKRYGDTRFFILCRVNACTLKVLFQLIVGNESSKALQPIGVDETHRVISHIPVQIEIVFRPDWVGTDPPAHPARIIAVTEIVEAREVIALLAAEAINAYGDILIAVAGEERRAAEGKVFFVGDDGRVFVEFEHRRAQVIRELVAEARFGNVSGLYC